MRVIRVKKPTRVHRRHPAFVRVVDGYEDPETGIYVLEVLYRDDDPNYEGGRRFEVYDENDEMIDEVFGNHHGRLIPLLEDVVNEHWRDYGRKASLRKKVIRLAHMNEALRPHLLPMLKEGFGNRVKGQHIIVSPDGSFSIQDIPKDPHGQVYDAAILIDKRATVKRAMIEVWKQYRREILAQRSVWKATEFIDEKLRELASRPLKGYIKWHHYSMPD